MSKRLVAYLDSGANCKSRVEYRTTTEEQRYTDEEWDELSEREEDRIMKEIAFQNANWGWCEQD